MNPPTMDPIFSIAAGAGGLNRLALAAPDGGHAEVYLYGAHLTSWVPAGGEERLFMSRASQFRSGAPIRGGVPVVFPQFGATGPLPLHGLARLMPWEFGSAEVVGERASAILRLRDTDDSRRLWANAFLAELTVALGGSQLAVTLAVINSGAEPFTFTAAFHTYLAVVDVATTFVEGLAGLQYRDAAAGGVESTQVASQLDFTGEVNRIYFNAPDEVRLVEPGRTTRIRKAGFSDAVVWNPGAAKCASMPDLEPEDYRRFVCVEAACIGAPVRLAPGQCWQGTQTLVA